MFFLFHQRLGQHLSRVGALTVLQLATTFFCFLKSLFIEPPFSVFFIFTLSLSLSLSLLDASVPVNSPQARGRTARMLKSA